MRLFALLPKLSACLLACLPACLPACLLAAQIAPADRVTHCSPVRRLSFLQGLIGVSVPKTGHIGYSVREESLAQSLATSF